ncbi:hypothetical protein [Maribacter arenosus]|uniref:Uncharacterized protein n=1 Tax=Maribacter arenosus TaxID=1854708 RepID=A0ABR7VC69_9FLAO|nr:hypothetical protein [Maribacter arenosus]MBD0850425.1 hypothetical protein [Maribacter arenosus]
MEFFRIVDVETSEDSITETLTLENLEKMSDELILLDQLDDKTAFIGGIWGEFTLERSIIKGGLRFVLKECPNALAWTITTGYPPAVDALVVHLTINRKEKPLEFIEEVEEFLEDHCNKLSTLFMGKSIKPEFKSNA